MNILIQVFNFCTENIRLISGYFNIFPYKIVKHISKYRLNQCSLYALILLLICLFGACKDEQIDLNDGSVPFSAIEYLDFETRTTHEESLSLYADDPEQYVDFTSMLNGEPVDLFSSITLRDAGYYELQVVAITDTDTIDHLKQFVLVDAERSEAEWGLRPYIPEEIEDMPLALSDLAFHYPKHYPTDISLPLIFRADTDQENWRNYYAHFDIDERSTTIKHGIGSILLPPDRSSMSIPVDTNSDTRQLSLTDLAPDYTQLGGDVTTDVTLEAEGLYHIDSDWTIEASATLKIPYGCVIKIDEGINIYNHGRIWIEGSTDQPVVFACADPTTQWGGFILEGGAASMEVSHAIFMQSGFHDTPSYQYGHANRQALFYLDQSELNIRDSYTIDNVGQIFYLIKQSELAVENCLVQRAKTAGEIIQSDISIKDCTFTDFPEYSTRYIDEDNDCIYLNESNATISGSSFMWSKDDGIDTGASGGGNVNIDDCYFEGIFHEAIAMSSGSNVTKNHSVSNCTFVNNGQGIEMGYSSPNHTAQVLNCHFENNMIGVRYGDNYSREVAGFMKLTDCTFEGSLDKDIWNFVRSEWSGIEDNLEY